jgi:predicted MFS family arabinose efflux permease
MRRLLAQRQARAYLAVQLLSVFGDTSLWLATGIWVKTFTGSASAAGMVFFFYTLPAVFAPLAGLVVDRVRRRPLMVGVNLVSAANVLLLLLVRGQHQLWLVYAVIFIYGATGMLLFSAQSALLRVMLPVDLLADANGVLTTGRELTRLVAPLLGAAVVAASGTARPVAVFDAATFLTAAVVLLFLRIDESAPLREEISWWQEVTAGARHVYRTLALRYIVIASAVALLVIGFTETLIFPVAQTGLHRSASFVGVLVSVMGVGAILGGLTGASAVRRLGDGRTLAVGLVATGVGQLGLTAGNLPVVLVGMMVSGAGIPWLVIAFMTSIQLRTPLALQGRALSAADMSVSVPQTLSIALGAGLVAVVDYRVLLVTIAVVMVGAGVWLLSRRVDWAAPLVDTPMPDPLPSNVPVV